MAVEAALDIDVIIAEQAGESEPDGHVVIVSTTNVAHFAQFVEAKLWADIG